MNVSVAQNSQEDPVSLEELQITVLADVRLHKAGWLNQQIFTTIRCDNQWTVLEWVDNHLLVIEHDHWHPLLCHHSSINQEGGGRLFLGCGGGDLFEKDVYFRGGANYRIYGI